MTNRLPLSEREARLRMLASLQECEIREAILRRKLEAAESFISRMNMEYRYREFLEAVEGKAT